MTKLRGYVLIASFWPGQIDVHRADLRCQKAIVHLCVCSHLYTKKKKILRRVQRRKRFRYYLFFYLILYKKKFHASSAFEELILSLIDVVGHCVEATRLDIMTHVADIFSVPSELTWT